MAFMAISERKYSYTKIQIKWPLWQIASENIHISDDDELNS
jgi:hypothetical protein